MHQLDILADLSEKWIEIPSGNRRLDLHNRQRSVDPSHIDTRELFPCEFPVLLTVLQNLVT